ncbi:unnamed protein product [Rotaria socialis]|uniref:F-box domain-containing protein n=1 Tax=Rotaria socialis TaxID=392032 RepID=A0A820RYL1_9BILA|nr:unnamed protein product [Rotaria socialis]CAF3415934.1 unnamed protein product [Rotaria socialis]CAF3442894.1 unnamed protein product [Rotaria socialis]CAF3742306.1 unnamed protein product [Rotaria socialis]CAF4270767.1 unnamed protein product [Rotaria socialis]
METTYYQSKLENLPDEILLEICKYLLCADILLSFVGLNQRIMQMITQYRHHTSLYKASIAKSNYLCVNILPEIGSQIRSILIDCCYSILQDDLFIKYFGKKMSIVFPQLEKISLVSYQYKQLIDILNSLHDLKHLVEIRLYNLFPIHKSNQLIATPSLMQANNHRFTTILIDDESSSLGFNQHDCYLNVIRLQVKLQTIADLSTLFSSIPNVQYLDVIMEENGSSSRHFDGLDLSCLYHLTDFKLVCTKQPWIFEDLLVLFAQIPNVRCLSLFLFTSDTRFIQSDIIISSLPSTIQQFNYAIYLLHFTPFDQIDEIITTWSPSHEVTCFFHDTFLLVHTLPWHFDRISFPKYTSKIMSCRTNMISGYDSSVKQLEVKIDKNFTLKKALGIISQCRRVKEITIYVTNSIDTIKADECSVPDIPELSRLRQVAFYGPIPSDLDHFLLVLTAAPNICRLDLPFDLLWQLIDNQQIRHILGHRITSLSILENATKSSLVTLQQEHIPIISSAFFRVYDIYANLAHLTHNTTVVSTKNILDECGVENLVTQLDHEKSEVFSSSSTDSMLVSLLAEFKHHKLTGLCITGEFSENIKVNTKHWLKHNTILNGQEFEAIFCDELHRLLIWM